MVDMLSLDKYNRVAGSNYFRTTSHHISRTACFDGALTHQETHHPI